MANSTDPTIQVFTIQNFKKGGAQSGFAKGFLNKRIEKFRGNVFGESTVEGDKQDLSKLNVIQRIMKNVTTPVLIEHNREVSKSPFTGE